MIFKRTTIGFISGIVFSFHLIFMSSLEAMNKYTYSCGGSDGVLGKLGSAGNSSILLFGHELQYQYRRLTRGLSEADLSESRRLKNGSRLVTAEVIRQYAFLRLFNQFFPDAFREFIQLALSRSDGSKLPEDIKTTLRQNRIIMETGKVAPITVAVLESSLQIVDQYFDLVDPLVNFDEIIQSRLVQLGEYKPVKIESYQSRESPGQSLLRLHIDLDQIHKDKQLISFEIALPKDSTLNFSSIKVGDSEIEVYGMFNRTNIRDGSGPLSEILKSDWDGIIYANGYHGVFLKRAMTIPEPGFQGWLFILTSTR